MKNVKVPGWFWGVVIFALLWNIMGVLSFIQHTFISEEALAMLPENESALYENYPAWATAIFAVAVFGGLFGSLGLLLRKRWSKLLFIISLSAVVPQMIHNLFFTKSMEVYGPGQATTMPSMIVLFAILFIWFSNVAIKKSWLK